MFTQYGSRPVSVIDARELWSRVGKWSSETFGPHSERGPIGPMKHLLKEINGEILPVLESGKNADILEYVDCLFLIMDAARRAGFTYEMMMKGVDLKFDINRARVWPKGTDPNAPIEHDRSK